MDEITKPSLAELNWTQKRIMHAILEAGGSITVDDLMEKTGMTRTTIKRHSIHLKAEHIEEVLSFKNGKEHLFRLKNEAKPKPKEPEIRKVAGKPKPAPVTTQSLKKPDLQEMTETLRKAEITHTKSQELTGDERVIWKTVLEYGPISLAKIAEFSGISEEKSGKALLNLVNYKLIEKAYSIEDAKTIIFRKKFKLK